MDPRQDEELDVAGMYVTATLAYVERACGAEGVERMLALAGEDRSNLPDDAGWLELDRMMELAKAAARVVGSPDIGRLVGEELFARNVAVGVDEMMRATGGPIEALQMLTSYGSRLAGGWTLEVTDFGHNMVEIESRSLVAATTPFFCGTGLGYYGKVPGVFGMRDVTVVHPECLTHGDDRCHYIIRWVDGEEERTGPTFDRVANLEHLQSVAAKLALADTPHDVVELAASLAPAVNDGRRFLIRASVRDGIPATTAQSGFSDPSTVDRIVDRIERGDFQGQDDEPIICVVPLTTSRGDFGWLASVHPPRSTIDSFIERPLASFAKHVASALEAATALETARRDRDTAHTLVAFARALAGATSARDVTDVAEEALAGATSCVDARLWLVDQADQVVRYFGSRTSDTVEAGLPTGCPPSDSVLRTVTDAQEIERIHLGVGGIGSSTVVPMIARGTVVGCVVVGWATGTTPTGHAIERLEAIVDQAALAIEVVRLVDDLQRQARHDALSGLANRALLAERAELAMAQASRSGRQVGVLFVDLDRFKTVNDELGHAAGDEVICQVADRLRGIVRAGDTVARLGGDEFVVLLTECGSEDDALTAGHRVTSAMEAPFYVSGCRLSVSATVGVFAAHPADLTWHALLDRADAAMYRGKQQGRNAVNAF